VEAGSASAAEEAKSKKDKKEAKLAKKEARRAAGEPVLTKQERKAAKIAKKASKAAKRTAQDVRASQPLEGASAAVAGAASLATAASSDEATQNVPAYKKQKTGATADIAVAGSSSAAASSGPEVVVVADGPPEEARGQEDAPPPPFSLWDPTQQHRKAQPTVPPRELAPRDALSTSITNTITQLEAARGAYFRAIAFLDEKQKLLQRDSLSVDMRAAELSKRDEALADREQRICAQEKEQRELKASTINVRAKYEGSLARIGELEARVAALEAENLRMATAAAASAAAVPASAADPGTDASSTGSSSASSSDSEHEHLGGRLDAALDPDI
jgi:hypothetical protein